MKSRIPLLAALCLVSAFAAAPSLAKADVNVSIGVAPPHHHYRALRPHGYVVTPPGYRHWQNHHHGWRGHHWQRDHHVGSRSHWNHRGYWGDRGRHHRHGGGHHGRKHRHGD